MSIRYFFFHFTPLLVAALMLAGLSSPAQAQNLLGVERGGQYPPPQYFLALEAYREGDMERAIEGFDQALSSTRRNIHGRWIDAIPVYAMLAECHWQLGNLPACRANLDVAMQLAVRYRGWLAQPRWDSLANGNSLRPTPQGLWASAASVNLLPIKDQMMFKSGEILTEQRLRRGGAIEEPNLKMLNVVEVMRGLAIASHRRRVLLGPLAEQEPLAAELLESTKYPSSVTLPLARNLIGAMRTTERFAILDSTRVLEDANQYSGFRGGAHPLTPLVLLVQASTLAETEDPTAAVPVAHRAADTAAALQQPEWIGEAMQLAAGCASADQASAVQRAATIAAEGMMRDSRLASLHCLVAAADAALTAGQTQAAENLLQQAQSLSSRRDVLLPRVNAYRAYVAARLAAAGGESVGDGATSRIDEALGAVTRFALNHRMGNRPLVSMPRIYQLGLIRQSIGGSLGGTSSEKLLKQYCDEPPMQLWRRDPVDAFASILHDASAAEAAWVELAAMQSEADEFLRRTDHVLASRFHRRLPLAGRLAGLRQMAAGDDAHLQRAGIEFDGQPPRAFAEVRQAIAAGDPPDPETRRARANRLESVLSSLALQRIRVPRAMPPPIGEADPSSWMPQRTGLLTFFASGNQLYGTLTADGKTRMWPVAGTSRLSTGITRLLRGIGVGRNRGKRLPGDEAWREEAVQLREFLIPEEVAITAERFDQLVIVPDGPLWYLPWEILPLGDADSALLGNEIQTRYAATPGLAVHPVAPPATGSTVAVVASRFFAPRDADANEAAVASITEALEQPRRLPGEAPVASSLLGEEVGHLMVAVPRGMDPADPLGFSVAAYDADSPAGTLGAWIRLPAATPRTVVLAGFRTAADTGRLGGGDEIFLALCGLQAAGVRDVMLSRWAVGGQSTALVMRELLQELPFTGMPAAWQRARTILRDTELDPAAEPLLTQAEHKIQGLTGDEPLFWAGYLLASPLVAETQ